MLSIMWRWLHARAVVVGNGRAWDKASESKSSRVLLHAHPMGNGAGDDGPRLRGAQPPSPNMRAAHAHNNKRRRTTSSV